MARDTFLTVGYKGFYIQSCMDNHREEVNAFGVIRGMRFEKWGCKSRHAAKCWITKTIKKHA